MQPDHDDERDDGLSAPDSESGDRKRLDARLLSTDRMASMGMLAAAIVHELNNPLGVTIANVTFALEGLHALQADLDVGEGESSAEMAARLARARGGILSVIDSLHEARDGGDRARLIVRDLRTFSTFSRADDEQWTALDVRRILESSINMAYGEIHGRARLVKDYGPTPLVEGNEARLGQVFLNLLLNAGQAVGVGGAEHHCIRVVTRTDGRGRCVVEVSDTGDGIAAENMQRVFEPFFTTKQRTSTGLGLSICQNVVTALGGEIVVESALGAGSTFRVTLPRARDQAKHTPASTRAPAAASPRCRVLVIDDEPMMARAVQRLLDAEHDVTTTSDPCSAVEQVRAGARFDAILCDLMMPVMNGMEVYEQIGRVEREQARRMVFMTGGAFTSPIVRFLETIENPRIEKPLEHEVLRAILRAHLNQRSEG